MSDNKSSCWSLTINNPVTADHEALDIARARGWKVDGQLECPDGGTEHYQLILRTPHIRFGAVKKVFPRAHIEAARNPAALASYVKKEETRVAALPGSNDRYPGQNAFFQLVVRYLIQPDKDGLDVFALADGDVVLYRSQEPPTPERLLQLLDEATRSLIREGYHVETHAVNPNVRSAWKKFGCEMILRAQAEIDEKSQPAAAAAAGDARSEEEVTVPTVEAQPDASISPQARCPPPPPPPPPPPSRCPRCTHFSCSC